MEDIIADVAADAAVEMSMFSRINSYVDLAGKTVTTPGLPRRTGDAAGADTPAVAAPQVDPDTTGRVDVGSDDEGLMAAEGSDDDGAAAAGSTTTSIDGSSAATAGKRLEPMDDAELAAAVVRGSLKAGLVGYAVPLAIRALPAVLSTVASLARALGRLLSHPLKAGAASSAGSAMLSTLSGLARRLLTIIRSSASNEARLGLFCAALVAASRLAVLTARQVTLQASAAQRHAYGSGRRGLGGARNRSFQSVAEMHRLHALGGGGGGGGGAGQASSGDGGGVEGLTPAPQPSWKAPYQGEVSPRVARKTALTLGALGMVTLFVAPPASRMGIALFAAFRSAEVVVKDLALDGWLPSWENSDTLLMMASSAEIVWAYVMENDSIDEAYRRFLAPFVGVSKPGIGFLRDAYTPTGGTGAAASHGTALQWEEVRQHWSSVDGSQLPAAMPDLGHAPCGILHAGKSCPHHIGSFFVSAYKRALRVYAPVHTLPLLIFGLSKLRSMPLMSLQKLGVGIARSSLFLSSYATTCWAVHCIVHKVFGVHNTAVLMLCGAAGGSAVALEKKSRRIELAMYVAANAVRSAAVLVSRTWLGKSLAQSGGRAAALAVWAAPCAMFGVSFAALVRAFLIRPDLLRPSYCRLGRLALGDPSPSSSSSTSKKH